MRPSTLKFLDETIELARVIHPESDLHDRIDAFVQEAGEALQAVMKLKAEVSRCAIAFARSPEPSPAFLDADAMARLAHARMEVLQCAGTAVRLLEEGLGPLEA